MSKLELIGNIDDLTTITSQMSNEVDIHKNKIQTIESQIEEIKNNSGNNGGAGNSCECDFSYTVPEVIEVPNPLTSMPLEYAQFKLSATTGTMSVGADIPFDTVYSGNMEIKNGRFILKANKTYAIDGSVFVQYATSDGRMTMWFKDYTNDIYIGTGSSAYATTSSSLIRGSNTSCKAIVTPEIDIEVGLQVYANYGGAIKTINEHMSTITVQEIRNNPIAQYGGFETEILFDGAASATDTEYVLSDELNNYDFLYVISSPSGTHSFETNIVNVSDVDYTATGQFMNSIYGGTVSDVTYFYSINYSFTDSKTLRINTTRVGGWVAPQITKIIGLKGQLPSILMGGDF